eukprot:scaffold103923_cov19-Tisochrysis_lutea.AAC.1
MHQGGIGRAASNSCQHHTAHICHFTGASKHHGPALPRAGTKWVLRGSVDWTGVTERIVDVDQSMAVVVLSFRRIRYYSEWSCGQPE